MTRFASLAALLLAGCSLAPEREVPPLPGPPPEKFLGATSNEYAPSYWWQSFDDPVLDELAELALTQNYTLAIRASEITARRAQVAIARSGLFPSVSGRLGASREDQPLLGGFQAIGGGGGAPDPGAPTPPDRLQFEIYEAALALNYEVDLWGRVRNQLAADQAELLASRWDLESAELTVLSELIRAYLNYRSADERLKLSKRNVATLEERVAQTELRYQRGLATSFELYTVRQELRAAETSIPLLRTEQDQAVAAMARAAGVWPRSVTEIVAQDSVPKIALNPPGSYALAQIVQQRPDLQAAAARVEAARQVVGQRQAERLPLLSFSISGGLQGDRFFDTFEASQWFLSLASSLAAPIFQGGALLANVRLAESQLAIAQLELGSDLVVAVAEAETALFGWQRAKERYDLLVASVEEARSAAQLQSDRFASGVGDYLDFLDAARSLSNAQIDLADARFALGAAEVEIYRALGGEWVPEPSDSASRPGTQISAIKP